jgi:hypothetical protein
MKKLMTAGFALSALFAASGKVQAEVNYPWCIMGDTRAIDCYFSSREQCMQDGRNRGFGGQCIQNPAYKQEAPTVSGPFSRVKKRTSQTASRAVRGAATCTGMRSACLGGWASYFPLGTDTKGEGYTAWLLKWCNSIWERCMKTGFWEGAFMHRPAEP